jgi:four helix bundle protein
MNNSEFKQKFKKRCFYFSISIIKLVEELKQEGVFWSLLDQLIRAATSIGANIVEGSNSSSKKEFINFFQISLKSASETLYWLAIIREINHNHIKEINDLIKECGEIKKIISTVILNTKSNSKF